MTAFVTYAAGTSPAAIGYSAGKQTVKPRYVPDTDGGSVTVSVNGVSVGTNPQTLTVQNGDSVTASGGACVFQVKIDWDYTQDKPLSIYHWVDMSDSLGDVDLHGASTTSVGIKGDYKYSRVIADRTGIQVTYLSEGGCGFYKGGGTVYGSGSIVSNRAANVPHDADIVTLWGSYNDQIIGSYIASNTECDETDAWYGQPTFGRIPICLDADGNPVWKAGVSDKYLYGGKKLTATVLKDCPLTETLTGIDGTPKKQTYAAYINEAVHIIKKRAPFAQIRFVSGGWCRNNNEGNFMWKNVQYLLWEMANRANHEWLNLLWCTYPGKGYPAGYVDTIADYRVGTDNSGNSVDYRAAVLAQGNPYKDFIDGWGLSYGQANSDHSIASDPTASDLFTVAYGWWASPGHPNDDFHEQFHAPVVCEYLCRQLGVDTSCLPERIRAARSEVTYKSGYTEYTKLAGMSAQVSSVSLSSSSLTVGVGETASLTAAVSPASATESRVLFVSSNDAVATVDASGTVTAVSEGTATVEAVTVDGGKRAAATVTVTASATRKHWKTYSAESESITITDEAGTAVQVLTVSDGNLAYVGDPVTVSVNGVSAGTNPQTLTVKAGDTVTASGGACVFRVQTRHEFAEDGSDAFYGLNWACVGDSLLSVQGAPNISTTNNYTQAVKAWEMISGQYAAGRDEYNASAVTNNMKRPALAAGINCYSGVNSSGTYFAQGGTGLWRNTPFYLRLQGLQHDADIVTIYGSINDWTYRVNGASGDETYGANNGKFFTSCNMAKFTDTLRSASGVTAGDWDNADGLDTYAKYVAKAIKTAHEQAPLAKIVVVSPIFYCVQGSAKTSRLYSDPNTVRYIVVHDYLMKNNPSWLSWTSWGLSPDISYDSGTDTWTVNTANTWADDTSILVDGTTISADKMMDDTTFAEKYVYDYSSTAVSYGHMNSLYNEVYLAPKFANLICDTLGLSGYYLPTGLKCNNLTYTAPDGETDPAPVTPTTYSITVTATGCTVSGASTITEGGTAALTVKASDGYSLPASLTVTGASYAWSASTGALTLSSPTAAVFVTVTAVKDEDPEPEPTPSASVPLFTIGGVRITSRDQLWIKTAAGMVHPAHIYDRYGNEITFDGSTVTVEGLTTADGYILMTSDGLIFVPKGA